MKPTAPHRGYTLVELLIAAAIALAVMAAAAALFGLFGRAASQSQEIVDLGDRMRSTAWQLRQDLAGATADLTPPGRPERDAGYFELIEGPRSDRDAAEGSGDIQADTDDILLFTTRSTGGPFVGKYGANFIESPVAEVAWFCRPAAEQPVAGLTLHNLHRRQLLVVGYVGVPPFSTNNNALPATAPNTSLPAAWLTYDISLRTEGPAPFTAFFPNTLGDLTRRESRFWHDATAFPFAFQTATLDAATFNNTLREGEDIVLTNVIAFDVRVFDPEAEARLAGGVTVFPGDPGYDTGDPSPVAKGAHVDLGWGGGSTILQSAGAAVSSTPASVQLPARTFDTWSLHYEQNGLNEDGDAKTDEGADGFDDNGDDRADDAGERETSPPYPVPLRGLEVRLRCYEPSSRQVRQITIRHSFLAE
jgi:prepilin-type N-terminal cleavage/methylation domain-containing protein